MLVTLLLPYSRKNQNREGAVENSYTFLKPPWNFSFFTSGNSRQHKAQRLDIPQNCVRSLGNSKAKNKDPEKFHIIFSWPPLEIQLRF